MNIGRKDGNRLTNNAITATKTAIEYRVVVQLKYTSLRAVLKLLIHVKSQLTVSSHCCCNALGNSSATDEEKSN